MFNVNAAIEQMTKPVDLKKMAETAKALHAKQIENTQALFAAQSEFAADMMRQSQHIIGSAVKMQHDLINDYAKSFGSIKA